MMCRYNNYLCMTYDLYGPVRNVFDAGRYITWASGRGLGPGNGEFFEPCEMASSPPPHPELIRNQQQTVGCINGRSGT